MWSLEYSQCRGAPHLARITTPALVIQSLADTGVFPGDAQAIFNNLGATDKRLELVAGDHYLLQPGNARAEVADLVTAWVSERAG